MRADEITECYLYPGERWFGRGRLRLRTLLGSCVAITLWNPKLRLGGMCHYLLPENPGCSSSHFLDFRYADEAMAMFLHSLRSTGTRPSDYQAGLFGGGNMFGGNRSWSLDIGQRNAVAGRNLLRRYGFSLSHEDLGGTTHRLVMLDLRDGTIALRRGSNRPSIVGVPAAVAPVFDKIKAPAGYTGRRPTAIKPGLWSTQSSGMDHSRRYRG